MIELNPAGVDIVGEFPPVAKARFYNLKALVFIDADVKAPVVIDLDRQLDIDDFVIGRPQAGNVHLDGARMHDAGGDLRLEKMPCQPDKAAKDRHEEDENPDAVVAIVSHLLFLHPSGLLPVCYEKQVLAESWLILKEISRKTKAALRAKMRFWPKC